MVKKNLSRIAPFLLPIIYLFIFLFTLASFSYAQTSVKTVSPALETSSCRNSGDVCDDSAIWIHPTDPSQSVVIGDDKNGGMLVWDLQGKEIQYIDSNLLMNNVDLRYNFPLQGTYSTGQAHTSVALVIVVAENSGALQVYKMNPTTRKLENVSQIKLSTSSPYGGCMYHSPVSKKYYFFVNWKSGVWQQIELNAQGSTVTGTSVRTADAGGQTEGCVADDVHKLYYIGEEGAGVWRYGAEPGDGATKLKVSGSELTADTEGMSLYYKSNGTGYLIVSSQGDDTFSVYERLPPSATQPNKLIGRFEVGANGAVDAVSSTDGLDVTNFALGSAFPQGLLVVHDASNGGISNHKLVSFQNVATALGLTTDTSWDPRKVGNTGGGGVTPTTVVPTTIIPTTNITVPPGTNCAKKHIGDADCKSDPAGKSITILDYATWYSEFIMDCSSANLSRCGSDIDGNGNAMDANFNYPGTNYITTDTIINSFDYAVWIQGFISENETTQPTPSPTAGGTVPTMPPGASKGIWISAAEIAALPASGTAWEAMRTVANGNFGTSALYNQNSKHPQYTLAAALVGAKKGDAEMCGSQTCVNKAVANILDILNDTPTSGGGDGRALGLGRNLAAYVIAADIINLKVRNPAKDAEFRTYIRNQRDRTDLEGACANLKLCHGKRPNNWGTMAGASRIATDLYLNDTTDLADAIKVFKGFIGDRASYASFEYQPGAAKYSCTSALVPINADGCVLSPPNCGSRTFNMSGAQIDDVQRDLDDGGGTCPPETHYAWGGFSGLVAQAEMLYRAGNDSYAWQNQAILRGMNYLATVMPTSASMPSDWLPWIVKKRYGSSSFSYTSLPTGGGRLMDWTDWTHQ